MANFRHPVSNSWLRHCFLSLFLFQIYSKIGFHTDDITKTPCCFVSYRHEGVSKEIFSKLLPDHLADCEHEGARKEIFSKLLLDHLLDCEHEGVSKEIFSKLLLDHLLDCEHEGVTTLLLEPAASLAGIDCRRASPCNIYMLCARSGVPHA